MTSSLIPIYFLFTLFLCNALGFVPHISIQTNLKNACTRKRNPYNPYTTSLSMASQELPPPRPALERTMRSGPQNIRYSDFLKLVDDDQIDKVTFR